MLRDRGEIVFEETADELLVHVGGEIDHHSAVSARQKIDERITISRAARVYLELSGVDFMDSSGLGLIMGRYALAKRSGKEFAILDPSFAVVKMMRLAGMDRTIRMVKRKISS